MISCLRDMPRITRLGPAMGAAALLALSGCSPVDEGVMRRALGASFALGETVSYRARPDCAAGVFRLASTDIRAAMPVLRTPARVAPALAAQGRAALDDPRLTPDRAMVRLANLDRALGMRIRRAGLEGRACMDDAAESAFRHVLTDPEAILAYDAALGAVILMDPGRRLLVVAMGRAK